MTPLLLILLWILALVGIFNSIAVFFDRFRTPPTTGSRIIDAIYSLCVGVIAAMLLYKG